MKIKLLGKTAGLALTPSAIKPKCATSVPKMWSYITARMISLALE